MSFFTIGHRGVMAAEPENTLRSFLRAEREGLDGIELDLHLSRDGELVVMHDESLDRTTDGSGPIADLELRQLKELDAGMGERIPTFQEVLDEVGPTLPIQAEIKDVAAAQSLAKVLADRDLLGRVSVLSFHDAALVEIHNALPQARTVLVAGASAHHDTFVGRAQKAGAALVSVDLCQLNRAIVNKCGAAGIDVMAWTVNDELDLRLVRALGLVGCVTDQPGMKRLVEATA